MDKRDAEVVTLLTAIERSRGTSCQPVGFSHWDNSAMDGYAVRYEDVKHCSDKQPVVLEL